MFNSVNPLHPQNAEPSIFVTVLGISTEAKLVQYANAYASIFEILLGINIDASELQLLKASRPMDSKPVGIFIDASFLQPQKTARSKVVILFGKTTEDRLVHP